jgi:enamine deaminase RidA (YjgF/YER057c/UK114 family)
LIFTSGVTSPNGDTGAQIDGCFEKLRAVLAEAGSNFDKVIKVTVYLATLEDREKYLNRIWKETFPTNPPSRTTIQAGLGPNVKVEIEMVATKK